MQLSEKPGKFSYTNDNLLGIASSVSASNNFDTLDALHFCTTHKFKAFQVYFNAEILTKALLRNEIKTVCKNEGIRLIAHAPHTLNSAMISDRQMNEAIIDLLDYDDKKFVVHHFNETLPLTETLMCIKKLNEYGFTVALENYCIYAENVTNPIFFKSYLWVLQNAKRLNLNFIPVFDIPRIYLHEIRNTSNATELINIALTAFEDLNQPIILHLIDVNDVAQNRNAWCPVGTGGIIPYPEIFNKLKQLKIPIEMIILEFEDKINPLMSIEFITKQLTE